MKKGPLIAILGLSGAGKSFLGRSIVSQRPEFLRLNAGKLLSRSFHTTGEKLRTADSSDVRENQTELASALTNARVGQWSRPVLLEAHSFIDNDRELIDVPSDVMASLGLAGIMLVDAPIDQIIARREKDRRKRPLRSPAELAMHRAKSQALAEHYAAEIGVPILTLNSGDKAKALAFIDKFKAETIDCHLP